MDGALNERGEDEPERGWRMRGEKKKAVPE
jgi:hypothetical protein